MFRRGMTSLALAATLLLAVIVPAVMADTFGGGNGDIYQAFGAWNEGNSNVNVGVTVGTSNGQSVNVLDIGSFLVQDITCKGNGKKAVPGITFTFISGETLSPQITIDRSLGTAKASANVAASEETYNSCTGVDTIRNVTVFASLDLTATSGTTSTRTRSVTTFPDGSKETFTDKFDVRDAAGGMRVGSTDYAALGQIAHDVSTDVLTPPPHH